MSKFYVYDIVQDRDPENPLERSLGKILSWTRYMTGSYQLRQSFWDWKATQITKFIPGYNQIQHSEGAIEREFDQHFLWLPVHVYRHSETIINTEGFKGRNHADWDWTIGGIIFVSKATVRQTYGAPRITRKVLERALQELSGDVKEYGAYIRGEVWCYLIKEVPEAVVEDERGYLDDPDDPDFDLQEQHSLSPLEGHEEYEAIDSCCGFFSRTECERQAKEALNLAERQHNQRLAAIHGQQSLPFIGETNDF